MRHQALYLGIVLRLSIFLFCGNGFVTEYFYPFIQTVSLTSDPWKDWLQADGRVDAFPYGLTLIALIKVIYESEQIVNVFLAFLPEGSLYVIFLIAIDVCIFRLLSKRESRSLGIIFVLSPITIYIGFFYLQTDAIVGFLFFVAAINLVDRKYQRAGIALGLSIGCKFGILLVIPFMITFALVNARVRTVIYRCLIWSLLVGLLNYLPALWSPSFRKMVIQTPEAEQIYALGISAGNVTFFVFPAIYLLLLIWIWRAGRTNTKVLIGFIGTALFSLSLASLGAVGWHLWGLPILIMLSNWDKRGILAVFYGLQALVIARDIYSGNAAEFGINLKDSLVLNLSFTGSAILGFAWAVSNLSKIVERADSLKLNMKPILIAIAGNSGVGKDTLAESLMNVFGVQNVTSIPGDSYHKYERGNYRWRTKSHLNPEQNRLSAWRSDVYRAISRKSILKSEYDHQIGRFSPTHTTKPRDFVICQGLHALDDEISKLADLRIFMEMDEITRIQFKLNRDVSQRGRSIVSLKSEAKQRQKDYEKHILPQRRSADIVFKQATNDKLSHSEISTLSVTIKSSIFADDLSTKLLPFISMVRKSVNADNIMEFHFEAVSAISNSVLYMILKQNLRSFDELEITSNSLRSGSMGIITIISLMYLEYKRETPNV